MTSSCCLLLLLAAISVGCGAGVPLVAETEPGDHQTGPETHSPDRIDLDSHILTRSAIGRDDPFVFPDELPEPSKKEPEIIKVDPTCPDGKEFCEKTDGYPEDYITNVLTNKISEYSGMFGDRSIADQELTIGHKVDPSAEISLCPSRVEEKEIRVAKNIYDEWRYVVNQGNYTQKVRMEVCIRNEQKASPSPRSTTKPGTYCSRINLGGFRTECKQKYVYRKLIALNKNANLEPDVFRIPSCCACVLKTDKHTTPAISTNK